MKRSSKTLDVSEERPSKRKCVISNHWHGDNTKWLKSEINDIKGSIGKIEARLRDIENKLEEILHAIA